jgi:enediyne biosynthesis protein E4
MKKYGIYFFLIAVTPIIFLVATCKTKIADSTPVIFEVLESDRTGLTFSNKLLPTEKFNMFNYMYFYNGAGMGAGDFNNDGLIDLFFASNQSGNKLFLNKGGLRFRDVSQQAKIPVDSSWSTGVSVVDINNDGLLDIYICQVGNYEVLKGKNQLLICKGLKNGIPYYNEEAALYGLSFSGFSTQAAFFDYDKDGDLDMFLLNHAIHQNGSFAPRSNFIGTYDTVSGDRMFQNENNHFHDVTKNCGINSSAIGYGLGIAVSDINMDGWPDIYVGNDFHENDYLYINQKNGTFKDVSREQLMHTSQFSMGVDIADANNDGLPEIISVDMLPEDPYILKQSLGDNEYDVFNQRINAGYSYQYPRNNLQWNMGDVFSETGVYSGIYATDWSWAPLWLDYDNDGFKDLFISNGIPKRLNDIDYINFVYNNDVYGKLINKALGKNDLEMIDRFPQIKIPNKFYRNEQHLRFKDDVALISNNKPTYSNGSVYADFDNDGDLDIVVSNIDDPSMLYENKLNEKNNKHAGSFILRGPENNRNALGAKVLLFAGTEVRLYEKNPVRGFMSSMEIPLHIGWQNVQPDSIFIIWPDNSFQKWVKSDTTSRITIQYQKNLPFFNYNSFTTFKKENEYEMKDGTREVGLSYHHKENLFNEFDREPLIPHMVSTEGPAVAVGDINKDGLDDLFFGSSKSFHSAIWLQQTDGKFLKTLQPQLEADSMYEDVDAGWIDVNNDGNIDLVVASGGNEYFGTDEKLLPRVYINNGQLQFSRKTGAFTNIYVTASCIRFADFNKDGFPDLFLGGRAVPWEYGKTPASYLLQNDGTGSFTDVTANYSKELSNSGIVTNAVWQDVNSDGDIDLIVCHEWGVVSAYIKNKTGFERKDLTDRKGWWNFVLPVDVDKDGDVDYILGNLGLNSRLHASKEQPVKLYYNDFDDNGKKEQVITYFLNGKETLLATKAELQKQIPEIKKKYLYAKDFARASLKEIFSDEKLQSAQVLEADYFANAILINNGKLNFELRALPWSAQLTSYREAIITDLNDDQLPDLLLAGNYYANNMQLGRNDSDIGTVLINMGKGVFGRRKISGASLKGEMRHIRKVVISGKEAYLAVKNNDSAVVLFKGRK